MLIDCHAHCYTPQYSKPDLEQLWAGSRAAGLAAIVTVPESLDDCHTVLQLAAEQPLVKACAGLHPVQPVHTDKPYSGVRCVALEDLPPALEFIRQHADQLVAVGEVGLDFSPHVIGSSDTSSQEGRAVQQQVFAAQIQAANDLGLPLNVHSRSAGHYAIDTLVQNNAGGALLHAFDGRAVHALKAVAAGYYLSVPASVVRSPHMQKLVQQLPLDHLVLETDSPALGPDKGGSNQPSNVRLACSYLAKAKGLSEMEVAAITTANAMKLFPRLQHACLGEAC
jgi:TatD DNase family protein